MKDRQNLREQNELESFDEDHYLADLMEPGYIEPYLSYECKYKNLTESDVQLSIEEKDLLKELPNKEYLMDENEIKIALHSMIDILYAACYNTRTTFGENTVESGWTVNKISSTLCWFQVQSQFLKIRTFYNFVIISNCINLNFFFRVFQIFMMSY